MEQKQAIKSEVNNILDEIIKINEFIFYVSGNGYTTHTLKKLSHYRDYLNSFVSEMTLRN